MSSLMVGSSFTSSTRSGERVAFGSFGGPCCAAAVERIPTRMIVPANCRFPTVIRLPLLQTRGWLIPEITREPVEILLHQRAVGLWLGDAVAEALENRELHRHVLIAQPLIELEGIRDRHARVLVAVLDQGRRL